MNVKRTLLTTAALGAVYLMQNKDARKKLMNSVQSFSDQIRARNRFGGRS